MKLYYMPGVCSLASHIALHEVGLPFEIEAVGRDKKTASGADYMAINPKGSVPALQLDGGEVLTEGVAIMQYVADSAGATAISPPAGTLARARMHEAMNFISGDLHKAYAPLFNPAMSDEAKQSQRAVVAQKLTQIERTLDDGRSHLTGDSYTLADGYVFTISNWSPRVGVDLTPYPQLEALRARVAARPAVQAAMKAEGLSK
jgi:glutathione S-transferase